MCCPYAITAESFHEQQTSGHFMQSHTPHAKWTYIIRDRTLKCIGSYCMEVSSLKPGLARGWMEQIGVIQKRHNSCLMIG